jgi:hypothetical protein
MYQTPKTIGKDFSKVLNLGDIEKMSWFLEMISRDTDVFYLMNLPLVSSFTSLISSNSVYYLFPPLQTLPVTFKSASKTP